MTVAKKLYVGNLTYDTTEDNLVELFQEFGEVLSAQIIIDRDTNRSKGFGFVEMADGQAADEAANSLNGQDFRGRNLTVNEAGRVRIAAAVAAAAAAVATAAAVAAAVATAAGAAVATAAAAAVAAAVAAAATAAAVAAAVATAVVEAATAA